MQDRYAGDVGDFGKFALLRALSPGRKLGVCWYLCSGEGETTNDGRHVAYLQQPERFRHLDDVSFDALAKIIARKKRSVAELEKLRLLPGAVYHGEVLPRGQRREAWFEAMSEAVEGCDLVFADPDNGISEQASHKHISLEEIQALRREGRALLVYHHQTRRKGGAADEARDLVRRMEVKHADVIRMRSYASRFYFLIDGDEGLRSRLHAFAKKWSAEAELVKLRRAERSGRIELR